MTQASAAPQEPAQISLPLGDVSTWQASLDIAELSRHVAYCRASAPSKTDQGKRLEHLACWLLSHLPGFSARTSNFFSHDGAQELDVLFWNERLPGGFANFGSTLMVECKNWGGRVDSSDVAWFDWKLRLGNVSEGILIAANGITTSHDRRGSAAGILIAANGDQPNPRKIIVVTLEEIEAIKSTDDLRDLLIYKQMALAGRNPLG